MDATKPYEFIGFGAMNVTKPYKSIGFGAMNVTKPGKSHIGGSGDRFEPYRWSAIRVGLVSAELCETESPV